MAYLCVGERVGVHACVYYITVWECHELYAFMNIDFIMTIELFKYRLNYAHGACMAFQAGTVSVES